MLILPAGFADFIGAYVLLFFRPVDAGVLSILAAGMTHASGVPADFIFLS